MSRKRYDGLDILKFICSFLVVSTHVPFPGLIGTIIKVAGRVAVTVFFIISGFFYDGIVSRKGEVKQLKKVFGLFLSSNMLFFVYKSARLIHNGKTAGIKSMFTTQKIWKLVLFNESMFHGHLWYLGSFLYVLIILLVLRKVSKNWKKILFILTPILLIAELILGKYSLLILGVEFPYIYVRNFLFVGLPYFVLGMIIREYEGFFQKIKISTSLILLLLFSALNYCERYLLISLDKNATREHYISSTFLAILAVIIFIQNFWNAERLSLLKAIGRKYAVYIYIVHPVIYITMGDVFLGLKYNTIYRWSKPILVYVISAVIGCIYYYLKKQLHASFQKGKKISSK